MWRGRKSHCGWGANAAITVDSGSHMTLTGMCVVGVAGEAELPCHCPVPVHMEKCQCRPALLRRLSLHQESPPYTDGALLLWLKAQLKPYLRP